MSRGLTKVYENVIALILSFPKVVIGNLVLNHIPNRDIWG